MFTPGRIGRMLGADPHTVGSWITKKLLDSTALVLDGKTIRTVSKRDLISFLCENQSRWHAQRCPNLCRELGYKTPPFWFTDNLHGKRSAATRAPNAQWTPEEDAELAAYFRAGKTFDQIAQLMVGRTAKAVERRKERLGNRLWLIGA